MKSIISRDRIYLGLFSLTVVATGCGQSEVTPISSSAISGTSSGSPQVNHSSSASPLGTGIEPKTSTISSYQGFDPFDSNRKQLDFERDLIRLDREQSFRAAEAAKNREQQHMQTLAGMVPVLAVTALFSDLTMTASGRKGDASLQPCGHPQSTYQALLKDSRDIFSKGKDTAGISDAGK